MTRLTRRARWGVAATALAVLLCARSAMSETVIIRTPDASPAPAVSAGATIETSGEADALLNRAREYIGHGQYREAVLLLQHVMDRYAHALTEQGEGLYQPAIDAVEAMIRQMGDEGLPAYRLAVDGQAASLLDGAATGHTDETALRQVTYRYFMSSHGDDAAYTLACLLIDAGRPVEATHLLNKIIHHHPDESIDRTALWGRLAVAAARSGNTTQAAQALRALRQAGADGERVRRTERAVAAAIGELRTHKVDAGRDWPSAYGNAMSDGVMPSLPAPDRKDWAMPWLSVWQHIAPVHRALYDHPTGAQRYTQRPQSRPSLVGRWQAQRWLPTAQVVTAGDRLFYKVGHRVFAVDRATGRSLWQSGEVRADENKQPNPSVYLSGRTSRTPWPYTYEEQVLFGDRLHTQLAVVGDLLLHVEQGPPNSPVVGSARFRLSYRSAQAGHNNHLAALDVRDGQVIWRSQIKSDKLEPAAVAQAVQAQLPTTRVLAAPVRIGHQLAVPVDDNGDLLLVMLDAETGETRSRHFLCSAPVGSAPRWAPVGLAADGPRLFIATGRGVVFAFNTQRQTVEWASRYERAPRRNPSYRTNTPWMHGDQRWADNAVFPVGATLVIAAADSERLHAFDRMTGRLTHTLPSADAEFFDDLNYVLGVAGGRVYLGGPDTVACYHVADGRLAWAAGVDGATGRAALTTDAVLVPKGLSAVRIDAITGKRTTLIKLSDRLDDPAGNLYSDGRRLYAAGLGRLVALAEPRSEIALLTEQVAGGQADALLLRATALEQIGRTTQARADLRKALSALDDETLVQRARLALIDALLQEASAQRPGAAALLEEAASLATDATSAARVALARAELDAIAGRVAQAAETYRQLVDTTEVVYVPVAESNAHRLVLASSLAQRRLSDLLRLHRQSVYPVLVAGGEAALAEVHTIETDKARLDAFCRVARMYAPAPAALTAAREALALADRPHLRRFALVEATLVRLTSCGDPAAESGAALLLAKAYADRGWAQQADDTAAALIQRHGDLPLGADGRTVAQVARSLRKPQAQPVAHQPMRLTDPPLATLWYRKEPGTQLAHTLIGDVTDVQTLRDNALLLVPAADKSLQLKLRDPLADDDLWRVQLPAAASYNLPVINGRRVLRGAVDRHTLIYRAANQVRAIDLAEGGDLWQADLDYTAVHNGPLPHADLLSSYQVRPYPLAGSIHTFDHGDGVYAERFWDADAMCDVLVAVDAHTGAVLWRRWFNRHTATHVALVGGWVAVLVDEGKVVWLCDRLTGKRLRTVRLDGIQPNSPILWTERGVVYRLPVGIGITPLDGRGGPARIGAQALRRMFLLDAERLAVVWADDSISMVDLRTRKELWNQKREVVGRGAISAALNHDDGELYIAGRNMNNNQSLIIVDAQTGQPVRSLDFGRYTTHRLTAETAARVGPLVPYLERQRTNSRHAALLFYNKADGQRVEDGIRLLVPKTHGYLENVIAPPEVRRGVLLIPMAEGLLAVGPANRTHTTPALKGMTPAAKSSTAEINNLNPRTNTRGVGPAKE